MGKIFTKRTIMQRHQTHLIQPLEEAVFVLGAPRLPLPTGPLLVTSLFLLFCWPLSLGHFGHPPRGSGHRPRLAHHPLGGRAILCPCTERRLVPRNTPVRKHLRGKKKKTQSKNRREICFGMIKTFCSSLWFHFGGQKVGITSCASGCEEWYAYTANLPPIHCKNRENPFEQPGTKCVAPKKQLDWRRSSRSRESFRAKMSDRH